MGSSMMLRFKLEQVISDNKFPIELEHDVLSAVKNYKVDFIVTMADLVNQLGDDVKCEVIGIQNIMDKNEIKEKLEKFLSESER